ncbi:MAG: T9SS type A sorting domain-containing protein [bacterium]
MKLFFTIIITSFLSIFTLAQNIQVEKPIFSPNNLNQWGNDNIVLNNEPAGSLCGIQKANGDIYIALADTISTTNLGLIIRKSTNNGLSWSTIGGVNSRGKYGNIKLIKSSLDSIYCFFQVDNKIYSWNVNSTIINPFLLNNYRAFDVEISSSNSIYIVVDSLQNNTLVRYASVNGGYNWKNRGSISTSSAMPKLTKSLTGDTLFLNYYGTPLADTATSILRVARYRELAPGTISSAGFQDLATTTLPKYEYKTAVSNGVVWFIYTVLDGKSEIWARRSFDGGTTYGSAFKINSLETVNNYWFDIKAKQPTIGGFDFVYYSDSTQTGLPSIETDKILFGSTQQTPTSFPVFNTINDIPAVLSTTNYSPVIIEMPVSNNTGVVWVGESAGGKKVYWDTFMPVPVELISFDAKVSGNSVELNWSTATETNNQGFAIEEKTNNEWIQIGFTAGMGTSTELNKYSFVDNVISIGKSNYRLKQIDFDGTSTYSNQIEVDVVNMPALFSLGQNYPNPFNPTTTIKFSIPYSNVVTLKVFDVLGAEVTNLVNEYKNAGTYEVNFDGSNLASGVYFYKLQTGNFTQTKKLLLLK